MWRHIIPNLRAAFLVSRGARLQQGACNPLPAEAGFKSLRRGAGAVVTPMASVASKEDVGKGGASPAPLPKILEA